MTSASHLGIESKSNFAKRLGVNKSTVTRWGKAGRLELAQNGKVLIEPSIKKINATQGHRTDVTERHAKSRGQSSQRNATTQQPEQNQIKTAIVSVEEATAENQSHQGEQNPQDQNDRSFYKAIEMDYGNKLLKLDESLERGLRISKEDFFSEIADFANSLKTGIEHLIDNTAPQIAGMSDPEEKNKKIKDQFEKLIEILKC